MSKSYLWVEVEAIIIIIIIQNFTNAMEEMYLFDLDFSIYRPLPYIS